MVRKSLTLFDSALLGPAVADSFRKLSPRVQIRNPVMFVVYIGSLLTSVLFVQALRGQGEAPAGFIFAVTAWLWFTVLFANFAEALAEGRGKAQAASPRGFKQSGSAQKLPGAKNPTEWIATTAPQLRHGDDFRAGGLAGLSHADDHRRPAVGHRRRRHESNDGVQRHRDIGPRGGGRGRCGRTAARQDRHHHSGKSAGRGVHSHGRLY